MWSTLSSCCTFQQHVNNYGCGRVNLHRQSKAAAGGGTHGAVRHLKHPPNCICRLVVKYLPLSCLIIAADSSDRGQKRSAAFELPLTSLSPYRLLSSTHDLALYIWQIYKPHTASKTGTPRLKGFVFFKEDSQCRKSTWCSSVVKSRIELGRSRSLQRCSLSPLKKKKNPLWREAEVVFMELERYVCSSCVCVETGGPKGFVLMLRGPGWRTQWDFSHSCLRCLASTLSGPLLCANARHGVSSCGDGKRADLCLSLCLRPCMLCVQTKGPR